MTKGVSFGPGNNLWLKTNPHFQLRPFIERIGGNQELGRVFRHVSLTGHPFSAAYLVAGPRLLFDPAGHASIPEFKLLKPRGVDFSGHFNILLHPENSGKKLFVYDHNAAPEIKSREQALPSLHEQFLFFSVLFLKSGAGKFSVRLAPAGEKAEAVDAKNWLKTSQMFLPTEEAEAEFLQQLKAFI